MGQRGRIEREAPDPGTRAMWNLRFRNTFRIGAHAEGILIRVSPQASVSTFPVLDFAADRIVY